MAGNVVVLDQDIQRRKLDKHGTPPRTPSEGCATARQVPRMAPSLGVLPGSQSLRASQRGVVGIRVKHVICLIAILETK